LQGVVEGAASVEVEVAWGGVATSSDDGGCRGRRAPAFGAMVSELCKNKSCQLQRQNQQRTRKDQDDTPSSCARRVLKQDKLKQLQSEMNAWKVNQFNEHNAHTTTTKKNRSICRSTGGI
jgi:hypothetical protein